MTKLTKILLNNRVSFPGLKPGDDAMGMLKLLTSKNPESDIAALVAIDGGFNPCDNSTVGVKRKKRSTNAGKLDWLLSDDNA